LHVGFMNMVSHLSKHFSHLNLQLKIETEKMKYILINYF
jgi:hypothetical protein